MLAIFEGGPLDGKDDYVVPDDAEFWIVESFEMPPEGTADDYVLPVVRHHYRRTNHVGIAGRFVYTGMTR